MMSTGNFDLDVPVNGGGYTRYFGKDLTNLENQQYNVRDSSQPIKSTLKSSGRDLRAKPNVKPTPLQFYKDIFKNQRLLHKRSQTNEANKSGSVDLKDLNRSKDHMDLKESHQPASKCEVVKQQLNKFLKVKTRLATVHTQDTTQENKIVIQEFQNERKKDANFGFMSNKDSKQENFSGRFMSIPTLIPNALQNSKFIGLSKQTPTNNPNQAKFQNSGLQKQPKLKPDRSNKNFQHLRLNLEEAQKQSPRRNSIEKVTEPKNSSYAAIVNELDELPTKGSVKEALFRQFDIPFIWEYLLVQEVSFALSRKACAAESTSTDTLASTSK